jgi:Zn-dependent peptidase ImmA (M78 family)
MAMLGNERQKEIRGIVENISLQTGYSNPDSDLMDLVQALGLTVFEVDFPEKHKDVNAILVYTDSKNSDNPSIYLKKEMPPNRKRFTIAHEIGHFLLHKKEGVKYRINGFSYNNTQYSMEETEANYFAAYLLVPDEKLSKVINILGSDVDLLAEYFGVSKAVIENRLKWIDQNGN